MQIYYDTTCGILINNSNNEYLIGHVTLGKYLAVNLDESEYKQRQFKNERSLKNYTIKLKLQQKEIL